MSLIAPIPARTPSAGQQRQMDRRFGMFLHFGVNTFGNVEWSDGGIAALSYQPTAIDADQWVRTAWQVGNPVVINLPPDVYGRLVQADADHLLEIAQRLGVRRE